MKWYYITNLDVSIKIDHGEADYTREHLGWKESEIYSVLEKQQEEAEKALDGMRFLTNSNDPDDVMEEALSILREAYAIDTDSFEFEPGWSSWFDAEELKVDEDGTLHLENQCDHCGEWVDCAMHINDYFSGKRPTCPKCGNTYTPCNECFWGEDCSVCPFKKHG